MRVWGRVPITKGITWSEVGSLWSAYANTWNDTAINSQATYQWQEVTTDSKGFNDGVYVTAFCQVLQLQTGESPFYADYGIPAHQSVMTQIFPDFNAYLMQQRYAPFFAALQMTKANVNNQYGVPTPVYDVTVTTQTGSTISVQIPT